MIEDDNDCVDNACDLGAGWEETGAADAIVSLIWENIVF